MKLITAIEPLNINGFSVFLAGGITNCPNWQKEVIEGLSNTNLTVLNPRRDLFPIHDPNASEEQIKWEFEALEKCDIFSMYFADADSDQPICMYELGRNIARMQMRFPNSWIRRIIITADPEYRRFEDVLIQTKLATDNKIYVESTLQRHISRIKEAGLLLQHLEEKRDIWI